MKALIYKGPKELAYEDFEDAHPQEGEELIRIVSSGICGSDMHAYLGHDDRRPAPLILGHEASGHIVGGDWDGRAVTINPLVTCGECSYCTSDRTNLCQGRQIISMQPRQGAFAQMVAMPRRNLVEVPDSFELSKAALAEPIACGWHAVRLGLNVNLKQPKRALVFGGGAIGVGAALSLSAQANIEVVIVEPNEERRKYLLKKTNYQVVEPKDLPQDASFDIVIDGVGFESTRSAASAQCLPGGVIMHIGLGSSESGLDIRRMTLQEITFIGTYTYTSQDFKDTAQAMFDGRLGDLSWTETRSLAEGAKAFADIRAGHVSAPKILLTPNG